MGELEDIKREIETVEERIKNDPDLAPETRAKLEEEITALKLRIDRLDN